MVAYNAQLETVTDSIYMNVLVRNKKYSKRNTFSGNIKKLSKKNKKEIITTTNRKNALTLTELYVQLQFN